MSAGVRLVETVALPDENVTQSRAGMDEGYNEAEAPASTSTSGKLLGALEMSRTPPGDGYSLPVDPAQHRQPGAFLLLPGAGCREQA